MKRTPLRRKTPLARRVIARVRPRPDNPPPETRAAVVERAGGRCERCAHPTGAPHVHHRRPKGAGGSSRPDRHNVENLVALCFSCHEWAHLRPTESRPAGYLIRRADPRNPATVPLYPGTGPAWLWLAADGTAVVAAPAGGAR